MRKFTPLLTLGLSIGLIASSALGAPEKTYSLRYQFHPGETLRWNVIHRSQVRTTVSGTTQVADTTSKSVKLWRVQKTHDDSTITFEHSVESVDMRQKLSGRPEVRYNSRTDAKAPHGFEDLATSVGIPLSVITMDAYGNILKRERKPVKAMSKNEGMMTIPLPEKPVPKGHTWSFPDTIDVSLNNGTVKKVQLSQRFTLDDVQTGVATIRVATVILTPIHDPAIESQLIEHYRRGRVRFDLASGRILSQQMDLDKKVLGFRGEASSLHYVTRFTEELLGDLSRTVQRPKDDVQ